jgi:hypothetical protein
METRVWIASASIDMFDMSEFLSTYPIQPTIRLKMNDYFNLQSAMYSNWPAMRPGMHPSHCCFNGMT